MNIWKQYSFGARYLDKGVCHQLTPWMASWGSKERAVQAYRRDGRVGCAVRQHKLFSVRVSSPQAPTISRLQAGGVSHGATRLSQLWSGISRWGRSRKSELQHILWGKEVQKRGRKYQSPGGCYGNTTAMSDIKDRSNNKLAGWDNGRPRWAVQKQKGSGPDLCLEVFVGQ